MLVPPARVAGWLTRFADRHGESQYTAGPDLVTVSAADGSHAWIEVPFPPLAVGESAGSIATALTAHLTVPRTVAVLLVRRGGYGVGIFDGATLAASKVGTSYVQSSTKAGGWSQQRYARRRQNQAAAAFAEAADQAARILLPEAARVQALFCGGDHGAIRAVLADVRLAPLAAKLAARFLEVGDPRLRVLQRAPEQFLAVRIRLHDVTSD